VFLAAGWYQEWQHHHHHHHQVSSGMASSPTNFVSKTLVIKINGATG